MRFIERLAVTVPSVMLPDGHTAQSTPRTPT
jgi:hypothetical protein